MRNIRTRLFTADGLRGRVRLDPIGMLRFNRLKPKFHFIVLIIFEFRRAVFIQLPKPKQFVFELPIIGATYIIIRHAIHLAF